MTDGAILTQDHTTQFEESVVPRFLEAGTELLLAQLEAPAGQVLHLGCRTGYADLHVAQALPGAKIHGFDPSADAIAFAEARARRTTGFRASYQQADVFGDALAFGDYTHVFSIFPNVDGQDRGRLFASAARLLVPGGQAVFVVPLAGAFQEVTDLLREYSLKFSTETFGQAVDAHEATRPTESTLESELRAAGFRRIRTSSKQFTVSFASGSEFLADLGTRILVLPSLARATRAVELARSLVYAEGAIDKYWSDTPFELSIVAGCVSGRVG